MYIQIHNGTHPAAASNITTTGIPASLKALAIFSLQTNIETNKSMIIFLPSTKIWNFIKIWKVIHIGGIIELA